jgi:NAD+ kinase
VGSGVGVKIGITANPNKPPALALARRAIAQIGGRAELCFSSETAAGIGGAVSSVPLEELEADVLVGIGGDGTFLYALQHCGVPLLPVHAGTVGFLAEVDGDRTDSFDAALERLLSGEYFVENRMKLAAQVAGANLPDATNELVVHTSQVAKMRHFEIAVDGRPIGRIRADGVILATPTGSTSYALSALGPIVEPTVEAILIAALAPFQVTQRAVLVDPLRTVSIRVVAPEKEAVIVVDGQSEHRLAPGEPLRAYRSPRKASFVRFGSRFFRRLRGKRILPWVEEPPFPTVEEDGVDLPPST